jgi:hypothetical protein
VNIGISPLLDFLLNPTLGLEGEGGTSMNRLRLFQVVPLAALALAVGLTAAPAAAAASTYTITDLGLARPGEHR